MSDLSPELVRAHFAESKVCLRCFGLKGHYIDLRTGGRFGMDSCTCPGDHTVEDLNPYYTNPDSSVRSNPHDLCRCCGLTITTYLWKLSLFYCIECKCRVWELNERAGCVIVPIGRHSLMHGFGIGSEDARDIAFAEKFAKKAMGLFKAIGHVHATNSQRMRRNLDLLALELDQEDLAKRLLYAQLGHEPVDYPLASLLEASIRASELHYGSIKAAKTAAAHRLFGDFGVSIS